MTCFQRIEHGKCWGGTLQWRSLANTTSAKWLRLTSPVLVMVIAYTSWCGVIEISLLQHSVSKLQSNHDKKKNQTNPNWRTFYKIANQYPSKLSRLRNKGSPRDYYNTPEETKETWSLNTMWNPGRDPGMKKGHYWKS